MSITADDVRAVAKSIAQTNRHPDPDSYASEAVAHFNADAVAQPADAPTTPAANTTTAAPTV